MSEESKSTEQGSSSQAVELLLRVRCLSYADKVELRKYGLC